MLLSSSPLTSPLFKSPFHLIEHICPYYWHLSFSNSYFSYNLRFLAFFPLEIIAFEYNLIINLLINLLITVDTKNSVGLVGCIEEVSHNAIAVYWNPVESSAKVCFNLS